MKLKYFIPIMLLALTSCGKVYFKTPQPVNGKVIKTFSKDLIGEYADSSIYVAILKDSVKVNNEVFGLSSETIDTTKVIVKYYKGFYFATFKENQYFDVYMASFYEDKLALYMLNGDSRSVNNLSRIVDVDTLSAEDEQYIINPTKREFNDIVDWEMFELISVLKKQ
jgi:hypothetical protein